MKQIIIKKILKQENNRRNRMDKENYLFESSEKGTGEQRTSSSNELTPPKPTSNHSEGV